MIGANFSFFEFFTFRVCPKCKFNWQRKYIKDEETKQIRVQYGNVHKREEINPATRVQYIIFRCLRCFTEIAESHQMITEEEFRDMNKITTEKLEPYSIPNIKQEDLLNDDELGRMIGM